MVPSQARTAATGEQMTALWAWITAALTSLSADPHAMNVEQPKAAAAVAVAYASFAPETERK